MSTLRRATSVFLGGAVVAAWIGCGEVVPNPAAETPTPDGAPGDGAATDSGDGAATDGGRLVATWHKEVRMNDTADTDASSSVGGYVAALGDGAELLVTAKGEYAGTVTTGDDPMLLGISPDGGTAKIELVGNAPGSQYGRFVMTTSQNHLFVATLDSAASPWASRIRRLDNPSAGPSADITTGGLVNVWAIAPWAGGFFYAGSSTPSGAPGGPSRALYGAVGTNAGRVDDGTLAEARTVAALSDGVAFGGHFTGGIGSGSCAASSAGDGGALKAGFVMRLNADRSCRWNHVFGADGPVVVEAVAADGYVIAAGTFTGTFAENGTRANDGVFLARLDAATGATQWVRTFTSVGATSPRAVRVDYAGRIVVTGSLGSRLDFGQGELVTDGQNNVFVATFTSNGAIEDSFRFGSGRVESFGLAIGPSNRLYVSGTIYSGTLGLPGAGPASDRWRTFLVALDRN